VKTASDPQVREKMEASDFLAYKDRHGYYADFHAFRHATGSFLAAAGVHPSWLRRSSGIRTSG